MVVTEPANHPMVLGRLRLLITDFDGVIADTRRHFDSYFSEIIPGYDRLKTLNSVFDYGLWDGLQKHGVDISESNQRSRLLPKLCEHLVDANLIPESVQLFHKLRQERPHLPVYVLSANSTEVVQRLLVTNNLPVFTGVFEGDASADKSTRISSLVQQYRESACPNLKMREVAYIGDTVSDTFDADYANVMSIAVAWRVLFMTSIVSLIVDVRLSSFAPKTTC